MKEETLEGGGADKLFFVAPNRNLLRGGGRGGLIYGGVAKNSVAEGDGVPGRAIRFQRSSWSPFERGATKTIEKSGETITELAATGYYSTYLEDEVNIVEEQPP